MKESGKLGEIRSYFPVLGREEHGTPIVYLDSAATALTPLPVIEAVDSYYRTNSCNIHRGLYRLGEEADEIYEGAREKVAGFISAASPKEIIFTAGTTASINLLAYSLSESLGPKDKIVATELEHHANLVPWQRLAQRSGAGLDFLPVDPETGVLREDAIEEKIDSDTALVTVSGMSNVTGVRTPLKKIAERARSVGAEVMVDAAQMAVHEVIDVAALAIDYLVFSGHKLYGPTGIGVLWAKEGKLADAAPFLTGGDMIEDVSLSSSSFKVPPYRFEAGTPHIAGAAGLSAVTDFLSSLDREELKEREKRCTKLGRELLGRIDGLRLFGPGDTDSASSVISFTIDDIHPHDIGTLLSEEGIAVRAGLHCAHPYVRTLGSEGTVRASFGIYNDEKDVETLAEAVRKITRFFRGNE